MPEDSLNQSPLSVTAGSLQQPKAALPKTMQNAQNPTLLKPPQHLAAQNKTINILSNPVQQNVPVAPAKTLGLGRAILAQRGGVADSRSYLQAGRPQPQPYSSLMDKVVHASDKSPTPITADLPPVRQQTDYTCGPASLTAVTDSDGKDLSEKELAEKADTSEDYGTSPEGLTAAAKKVGVPAHREEPMSLQRLKAQLDQGKPVICNIQAWGEREEYKDLESGHYVDAVGMDEKNVYFRDPSIGEGYGYLPIQEFLSRWKDQEDEARGGEKTDHLGIVIDEQKPAAKQPAALKKIAAFCFRKQLLKLSAEDLRPYRDRVEMFGLKGNKVLGGLYAMDANHGTFGGGIDLDEDPATAGAREYLEESGWRLNNPRLLDVPPVVHEWAAPYASPEQEARAKKFRGSRTLFGVGDIDESEYVEPQDPSNLINIRYRSPATALRHTVIRRAYSPETTRARRLALRRIIQQLQEQQLQKAAEYSFEDNGAASVINQYPSLVDTDDVTKFLPPPPAARKKRDTNNPANPLPQLLGEPSPVQSVGQGPSLPKAAAEDPAHVLISGYSGSGKSTLAKQLADQLSLPTYHLDNDPDWIAHAEEYKARPGKPDPCFPRTPAVLSAYRKALQNALSRPAPHVIEGIGVSMFPELTKDYRRILTDVSPLQLVRQRLGRDRAKGRDLPPGSPAARLAASRAREYMEQLRPALQQYAAEPGVERMKAKRPEEREVTLVEKSMTPERWARFGKPGEEVAKRKMSHTMMLDMARVLNPGMYIDNGETVVFSGGRAFRMDSPEAYAYGKSIGVPDEDMPWAKKAAEDSANTGALSKVSCASISFERPARTPPTRECAALSRAHFSREKNDINVISPYPDLLDKHAVQASFSTDLAAKQQTLQAFMKPGLPASALPVPPEDLQQQLDGTRDTLGPSLAKPRPLGAAINTIGGGWAPAVEKFAVSAKYVGSKIRAGAEAVAAGKLPQERLDKLAAHTQRWITNATPEYQARVMAAMMSGQPAEKQAASAYPALLDKAADLLPGGRADFVPENKFDPEALAEGAKHEKEHTDNAEVAKEIAEDHLVSEGPDYYKKLEKMEKEGEVTFSLGKALAPTLNPILGDYAGLRGGDMFGPLPKTKPWSDADIANHMQQLLLGCTQKEAAVYLGQDAGTTEDAVQADLDRFQENTGQDLSKVPIAINKRQPFRNLARYYIPKTLHQVPSRAVALSRLAGGVAGVVNPALSSMTVEELQKLWSVASAGKGDFYHGAIGAVNTGKYDPAVLAHELGHYQDYEHNAGPYRRGLFGFGRYKDPVAKGLPHGSELAATLWARKAMGEDAWKEHGDTLRAALGTYLRSARVSPLRSLKDWITRKQYNTEDNAWKKDLRAALTSGDKSKVDQATWQALRAAYPKFWGSWRGDVVDEDARDENNKIRWSKEAPKQLKALTKILTDKEYARVYPALTEKAALTFTDLPDDEQAQLVEEQRKQYLEEGLEPEEVEKLQYADLVG